MSRFPSESRRDGDHDDRTPRTGLPSPREVGWLTPLPFLGETSEQSRVRGHGRSATNTFTLTADCGEVTSPLTVPDGITTVEGGGHIITATDPDRRPSFTRWQW